jgi:predicted MPP superfamily phosphohydrolase
MRAAFAWPAGVGLLVSGAVGYAAGIERNAFRLRRFTVPVLPPGAAPVRVLHLSDVHMTPGQRRKQAFISSLASLEPDLVVTTGDNLGGVTAVPAMLAALAPFAGTPGAFVLGSNDYYAPRPKNPLKYFRPNHKRVLGTPNPWPSLVEGLRELGWVDLTNRRTAVGLGGLPVELAGVDDPHLKRDRLSVADQPVTGSLGLALVHAPEPRVLDRFAAAGFALLLCGHTHGGQLRVPFYGALVTNCGIDRRRARGLSRYGDAWLHVSAGLGTSPYAPVRFACPPEASLLTLVPVDSRLGAAGLTR